jgi:hypothetical protein
MPFAWRRRDHRDAAWPARALVRPQGNKALTDDTGAVLSGDADDAGGPFVAEAAERWPDDAFAKVDKRDTGREPVKTLPGPGLISGDECRVQPVSLRRPVTHLYLRLRRPAGSAARSERADVGLKYLVTPAVLPCRQNSLANPAVGRLVMHAKRFGRVADLHA